MMSIGSLPLELSYTLISYMDQRTMHCVAQLSHTNELAVRAREYFDTLAVKATHHSDHIVSIYSQDFVSRLDVTAEQLVRLLDINQTHMYRGYIVDQWIGWSDPIIQIFAYTYTEHYVDRYKCYKGMGIDESFVMSVLIRLYFSNGIAM